jgi:DHA2 family multidrug resistance protein
VAAASLPRSAAKPGISPYLIAGLVSFGTLFEALDSTALAVALQTVSGNLGATPEESDGILTAYLVANAAIMPVSGWAAVYFGRKRYFITCVILFTIASALCAVAWSVESLLFFRVLQGAAAAGNAASESSIIADSFPPEKRGQGFAIYGMAVVVGPTIGPIFGGWAAENYSWTWIFWSNVPVGVLAVAGCIAFLEDKPAVKEETAKLRRHGLRLDWVGLALGMLGLATLEIMLDQGQSEDWFDSGLIVASTIIAIVCLLTLPFWESFQKNPILDFRLFLNPNFAISFFGIAVVGAVLFGGSSLFPLFLQQTIDYTATWAGIALAAGGLTVLVLMPIVGVMSGKIDTRHIAGFGFVCMAAGLGASTIIYPDLDFWQLSLIRAGQALGVAFLFIPLQSHAYIGTPGHLSEQVGAFLNLARNLGGSIGTAIGITLLERGRQSYRDQLIAHTSSFDPEYREAIAQYGSPAAFNSVIDAQATVLAYEHVFFVLTVISIIFIPLVFFLKGRPRGTEAGG